MIKIKEITLKKTYFVLVLSVYAAAYLAISFVNWDFMNPIDWLIELPLKTPEYRVVVMVFWACINMTIAMFAFAIHSGSVRNKAIAKKREFHD